MSFGEIIVVDDDKSVRDAVAEYLERHGYSVRTASGAVDLDAALSSQSAHVIILDVMMPGEDGLSICRRLAPTGSAIIIISALGGITDRVVGLELGAADYLPKPFDPRELVARIRAVMRRRSDPTDRRAKLTFEGWHLDVDEGRLASPDGEPIELTAGELRLLRAFAERPRLLLSRERLLEITKGSNPEPFDRAIDLAISRLRRKLDVAGGAGMIETVRGLGYRFNPAVSRT